MSATPPAHVSLVFPFVCHFRLIKQPQCISIDNYYTLCTSSLHRECQDWQYRTGRVVCLPFPQVCAITLTWHLQLQGQSPPCRRTISSTPHALPPGLIRVTLNRLWIWMCQQGHDMEGFFRVRIQEQWIQPHAQLRQAYLTTRPPTQSLLLARLT